MYRRISTLFLGLGVAVFYVLYRSISPYLVWDDTNWVHINAHTAGFYQLTSIFAFFKQYCIIPFSEVSYNGYRPLNSIIRLIGSAYFVTPNMFPQIWFAAVAVIEGIGAMIIFKFLRRILRTEIFAASVLFVFLTSTPIVSSYWIVLAAVHILVPTSICLGLELYFCIREDRCLRIGPRIVFFIVMFFGSWYREFIGILPLLVILLEILYQRKITKILLAACAAFIHAIFPTVLMRIFFHDLPLSSIFQIGLLGQRMGGINLLMDPVVFLYHLFSLLYNFYSLIPPMLWIIGLVALVFLLYNRNTRGDILNKKVLFLFSWFLLSFLPFLKIYTEQVHLAYCLLPALVILGVIIERFLLWVNGFNNFKKITMGVLVLVLVIVLADYGANLFGSAKVIYEINRGMIRVAEELQRRLPPGSIVIGNALHTGDIQMYSKNYFTTYYSVRAGVPWPEYVVFEKKDLQVLARQKKGKDIYFLSMDFNYTPDKAGYHRHKFVYDDTIVKEYLGKISETVVQYFYFDPLKNLTPRPFISFLGPPDLENDFYRGPCRGGKVFCREVYTEYHLYKYVP